MFLVFETCLNQLFKYCPKCGKAIDQTLTTEVPNVGSQFKIKLQCFNGCDITWAAQPELPATRGIGNLMVASAIDMSGLSFEKIKR